MALHLSKSLKHFRRECVWISITFQQECAILPVRRTGQLAAEMAIVRLHDAWARYCRDIIVRSACGALTLNHVRLAAAPGITGISSVIPVLLSKYRRPRIYEPKWATATECIDAAQRLSLSNVGLISATLGAAGNPANELRQIRNYYAHRNESTALNATSSGRFIYTKHPNVWDLGRPTNAGANTLDFWIDELDIIAEASIQ